MSRSVLVLVAALTLGCRRGPEPAQEQAREAAAEQQAPASPASSPACGRLEFVETDAEERSRVMLIPAAGGPATPLREPAIDPEGSSFPVAQSPDGRRLLLLSSREGPDGMSLDRLWIAELEQTPIEVRAIELPEAMLRSPSWAPTGRWLAFESAANSFRDLYRVELDSGAVLRLTDDPQGNFEPAISPDGEQIAFVSSRDGNAEIYLMNSDGGDPRRLTTSPGDDVSPRWSPDGRTLAFVSGRDRKRGLDVFVMDADGSDQRPLLGAREASVVASALEFSPDGSRLAFTEQTPSRGAVVVVVVALERGELEARIAGSGLAEQPSWSPDGQSLAFARSEGERSDLVRVRADGSDPVVLTDGSGERWLPRWLADDGCPRVSVAIEQPSGQG